MKTLKTLTDKQLTAAHKAACEQISKLQAEVEMMRQEAQRRAK